VTSLDYEGSDGTISDKTNLNISGNAIFHSNISEESFGNISQSKHTNFCETV